MQHPQRYPGLVRQVGTIGVNLQGQAVSIGALAAAAVSGQCQQRARIGHARPFPVGHIHATMSARRWARTNTSRRNEGTVDVQVRIEPLIEPKPKPKATKRKFKAGAKKR
jgi:hypothetical protein